MDIQVIGKAPAGTPQFPGLGELIGRLGSPAFPDSLFRQVRKLCGCAHFVALTSSERKPIEVVLATNEGHAPLARETADKYVADHWRYDPINTLLQKLGSAAVTVRTTPQDICSDHYRKDCYSRTKLIERLSILRRRDGITSRLHLYRASGTGSFSDREVATITGASEILFSLVAKHSEIAAPKAGTTAAELHQRLLDVMPQMPRREADVCIGIARGQTSEAIALGLRISVNTVLTYRKRAYARLHISSANELLALIYVSKPAAPHRAGQRPY